MKKATLAIAASLSLNHCHSAQYVRLMTTDDQILEKIVRANVAQQSHQTKEVVDESYSDAMNALRRCKNYAADLETIATLTEKMEKFYEEQFGYCYIYKIAIHMLQFDWLFESKLLHFPRYANLHYSGKNSYANEYITILNGEYRFRVFNAKGTMSSVKLGFHPETGQERAPFCYTDSDGITILNVIESYPARLAHESGHYYYISNCKEFKEKWTKVAQDKTAESNGLTLVSEILALLFEFRYRLTHEDDLKTGDAYDVIGIIALMLDSGNRRGIAMCYNLALSLACLDVDLNTLVDETIDQLKPMWSDADIVTSLKNCESVSCAKPEDYGITFSEKQCKIVDATKSEGYRTIRYETQRHFVMKYNAAENLRIMKRWLNQIGYDDADATINKIKRFYKEAYDVYGRPKCSQKKLKGAK